MQQVFISEVVIFLTIQTRYASCLDRRDLIPRLELPETKMSL